VLTIANKRLLISESRGDSNRCTPYRGKPDEHATRFPCSICVWPLTIHISRGPCIATFYEVVNSDGHSHCSWEKGLPTKSTAQWLIDLWVCTQFLSQASHWSSGGKATLYWWHSSRLTGPISSACDQYIQNLLTRANPSVLNQHRQGYSNLKSPTRSQVIHSQYKPLVRKCDMKHLSLIRGLSTTRHLPKSISMPSND
jgi:hypothetical protein